LVIVGARPCHQVTVADSRGPASLADLSAETGAQAAEIEEAVRGQEVVVVAVPMKNPEPAREGVWLLSIPAFR
jgi:predicted dinucleotide-binding enzyme